ncbi:MAG: AAA family ATPase [Desulfurococcales archaeon]|nr:AAA family ATPase [Desulfurococcales archaeon]
MNLKFSIRKLPPLELDKPATIDINKTILYGPNGVGKSNILRILLTLLLGDDINHKYLIEEIPIDRLKNDTEATLYTDKGSIELSNGKYIIKRENKEVIRERLSIDEIERIIGLKTVGRIIGDHMITNRGEIDIWKSSDINTLTEEAEFSEKIIDFFIDLGIERLYYKKYRENGEWREIQFLPYGFRRAFMILYTLEHSDIIFIEGFENGMHIDLIRKIIEYIDIEYKDKIVIIETHNSLPLKLGVLKRWSVYYIDRNLIKKLSGIEDLRDVTLFNKEIEAITI